MKLPARGRTVKITRAMDTIAGTYKGCVPANENGRAVRDRERRLVIEERPDVVEYVPESDVKGWTYAQ